MVDSSLRSQPAASPRTNPVGRTSPPGTLHVDTDARFAPVADWIEAIDPRLEIETAREAGEQVLAITRVVAKGSASGAETTVRLAIVFSFRDARISAQDNYYAVAEALEAVGLSE